MKILISKKNIKQLIILFLSTGILFYVLNIKTPLFADDYTFLFSFYNGKPITNLNGIIFSLKSQYLSVNGRIVLHFFAQVFLLMGKKWFDIINTFAFLFLGFLIFYHGTENRLRDDISTLIFIYCSLFTFVPTFGQSFLWLTGSSNYLYGIGLVLLYLLPFRYISKKKVCNKKRQDKIWLYRFWAILKSLLMLLFGFIAGATNENTSIGLIVIVFAYIFYYRIHKIKISFWIFSGCLGNIMGCVFMLLSPGEMSRLDTVGGINITRIIASVFKVSFELADYFFPLIILFVFLISLYIYKKKDRKRSREFIYNEADRFSIALIYLLGFLASSYSLIVSPYIPNRVWSGPLALLLITIISFWHTAFMDSYVWFLKKIKMILMVTFSLIVLCIYGKALYELEKIDHQNNLRTKMIEKAIAEGQDSLHIPAIKSKSKYSCFEYDGDLSWDPNDWPNTSLEEYFGISQIIRDDSIILEVGK